MILFCCAFSVLFAHINTKLRQGAINILHLTLIENIVMDYTLFGPLLAFAFVSTFSPGPNNIMLMTSGANVGFLRTIPHMLGITFGFSIMVLLVGVGLTELFQRYPLIQQGLQILCTLYLVYLAVKIALSRPSKDGQEYQPMSLWRRRCFSG